MRRGKNAPSPSGARGLPLKRGAKILLKIIAPAAFWLGLWWFAAHLVDQELFLPRPLTVAKTLAELLPTALFWQTTAITLLRIVAGTLIGVLAGAALAIATFVSPAASAVLSPAIRVARATPVASFIILVLLWVGSSAVPVVISALMVLPVVWENTSAGLMSPPPELMEMAKSYEMGLARRLRYIHLPAALPYLRSAVLSSVGLAWKSGVAAEVLAYPRRAIGTRIYYSKLYLEVPSLFAWTIVVVALSLVIEGLIRRALGGGGKVK